MKKIIKATAFALVVAFCLALVTDFLSMTDREDTMHVRGYFEEPNNSIDVLMIGASKNLMAVDKFSYDFSHHGYLIVFHYLICHVPVLPSYFKNFFLIYLRQTLSAIYIYEKIP